MTRDPDVSAAILELQGEAESVLRPLVRPGEPCALVDFPDHGNVGDNAIWLGERAMLARLGARVVYACDWKTLREDALRKAVGDGPIFLHGGGNLGDLWPEFQLFREHVLLSFPGHRIVQLPQSIHFQERRNLERARKAFAAHRQLTVLARERKSQLLARSQLGLEAALCPDLAFALGSLPRSPPVRDVVLLARRDKEARGGQAALHVAGASPRDWEHDGRITRRLRGLLRRALGPRLIGATWRVALPAWEALARARLRAGVRQLCQGRVVVTDRLHGHILCLQLGIPHVAVDNSYGKVRGFVETWTARLPLVELADSPAHAEELARGLLERQWH